VGRPIRYEATAACKAWARKQAGTRSPEGRRLPRWGEEHLLEEMAPRGRSRPEGMKRRQHRVAHPLGTMQRWWDAGDFLMRGREKVQAELRVTVLAYNLRRVLHILGMPRLMAALGGVGRVWGRAAPGDVQEALWAARWPTRHTKMELCGSQGGWAA
jgi:hypothetical protein